MSTHSTVRPAAMATAARMPVRELARAVSSAVTAVAGTRPSPRTVSPKKSTASTIRNSARHGTLPSRPSALGAGDEPLAHDEQAEHDERCRRAASGKYPGPMRRGVPSS